MKKTICILIALITLFSAFQMTASAALFGKTESQYVVKITVPEPVVGQKVYPVKYTCDKSEVGVFVTYEKRKSGTSNAFVTVKESEKFAEGYDYRTEIIIIYLTEETKPDVVVVNGYIATYQEDQNGAPVYIYEFGKGEKYVEPEPSFFDRIRQRIEDFFAMIKEIFTNTLGAGVNIINIGAETLVQQ